jgi:hypothetical protein
VIESLHVATGAAIGELSGSRLRAFLLGPPAHLLGDLMPHDDIPSDVFEGVSGLLAGLWVAQKKGFFSPATVGAFAATLPDFEHLLRRDRRGKREWFPSHRYKWLHTRGGLPAWVQLAAAVAILAAVARSSKPAA